MCAGLKELLQGLHVTLNQHMAAMQALHSERQSESAKDWFRHHVLKWNKARKQVQSTRECLDDLKPSIDQLTQAVSASADAAEHTAEAGQKRVGIPPGLYHLVCVAAGGAACPSHCRW